MRLVETEFDRLPDAGDTPPYTDIQRIFNKSCIECHGGLSYPPARNYAWANFDLSEDENPAPGQRRLWRSLSQARTMVGGPGCLPSQVTCTSVDASDLSSSRIYQRITDDGDLVHPYNPSNIAGSNEDCPNGVMPCGGPPLSKTDIKTIERWIIGSAPNTEGDPHIRTVDGVNYDFQSAGEFVLLRDEGMELQARQSAVTTAGPLQPNAHTGLSSCVSVNTAVAMRVGEHIVTYQPDLSEQAGDPDDPDTQSPRLQLRIDGKATLLGDDPIPLREGGRIVPTNNEGGLEVQIPGGTRVAVTPMFWQSHQVHFMQINVYHARAIDGIMGAIAPNNWLPRLSNGDFLGPRPASLAQRHQDLYETFADSWRVDATSSLFYYEPGLNSDSFVVPDWPVSEAQNCLAPPQPGVPVPTAPITAIGQAQAEQICSGIVDPNRRDNCVQDVMATGDAIFAEAYEQSQALDQRILIAPVDLVSPANNAEVPTAQVDFEWSPVPGTEEIDVTHYHCLWKSAERYDFNNCTVLDQDGGPSEPTRVTLQDLEAGESYHWKVVNETKDGLIIESETRRFEISSDAQGGLPPNGCIDFESLSLGTRFNVNATFTEAGVTIAAVDFQWSNGTMTSDGFTEVESGGLAGGFGQEMWVNNILLQFDFGEIVQGLTLQFGEFGGNLNVEINGEFVNFGAFSELDGATIGGVNVSVTNGFGNNQGTLKLSGSIDSFAIGGQELWIDNVCPLQ